MITSESLKMHSRFAPYFDASTGMYSANQFRPIVQPDGQAYIQVNHGAGTHGKHKNLNLAANMAANASAPIDCWKSLEDTIMAARRNRLTAVDDLEAANLTVGLNDGNNIPGATIFQSQKQSDEGTASLSMSGTGEKTGAQPDFDVDTLPLPFCVSDFEIAVRLSNAAGRGAYGSGVASYDYDSSTLEKLVRRQRELQEDLLLGMNVTGTGAIQSSPYKFAGASIYGYLNFPTRETQTFSGAAWDTAAGSVILADVLAMIAKMKTNKYYGGFTIYVPTAYSTNLDSDFKAESDKTIRQRLLDIDGIEAIKTADRMVNNHVVMVAMESSNVRLVNGMDFTPITWTSQDQLTMNMKLLSLKVPQIRDDYNGATGVIDLSA